MFNTSRVCAKSLASSSPAIVQRALYILSYIAKDDEK
jgi:hypothetical protein